MFWNSLSNGDALRMDLADHCLETPNLATLQSTYQVLAKIQQDQYPISTNANYGSVDDVLNRAIEKALEIAPHLGPPQMPIRTTVQGMRTPQ